MNRLITLFVLTSVYALASEQVRLDGVTLRFGDPIEVSSTVGRAWFPTLAKFKTGELMALYALTEDSNAAVNIQSGFQISRDGGKNWSHRWDIFPEFGSTILFPQNDGSMLVIPHLLHMDGPGGRSFHGIYTRIEQGGKRVLMEPGGLKVVDWPWQVNEHESKTPRSNWLLSIRFDGNAVPVGNRLIAPMYVKKKGEPLFRVIAAQSEDAGHTWTYLSEVAGPDVIGDRGNQKNAEGPNETGLIRLANGSLMIVYRTGNGAGWQIGRAYSSDDGRTWSKSDMLPAIGVEPSIVQASNGVIALSTGRPGLWLWISSDDRGRSWRQFDLLKYHNRWAPGPTHRITMRSETGEHSVDQSTAYTEIIEVSPNRLLLIYDRTASGWEATGKDSGEVNRIYVLPIEVARDR